MIIAKIYGSMLRFSGRGSMEKNQWRYGELFFFKMTLELEGMEGAMNSEYCRSVLKYHSFHVLEDYNGDIGTLHRTMRLFTDQRIQFNGFLRTKWIFNSGWRSHRFYRSKRHEWYEKIITSFKLRFVTALKDKCENVSQWRSFYKTVKRFKAITLILAKSNIHEVVY